MEKGFTANVLDKGYVKLVDWMGDDFTPANDARISTGTESKNEKQDETLIRYLLRHKHTSVFEGCIVKFQVCAPIMVIREWFRHRTFSYNEESGRYKMLDPLYYLPEPDRIKKQSSFNKQGSGENFEYGIAEKFILDWRLEQNAFEFQYNHLINDEDMSKELARLNMPVSHYSTFIVTGNLLNWFRFLQLRMAEGAQWEIRQYANIIFDIVKELYPISTTAFKDYWIDSISFSKPEIEILRYLMTGDNVMSLLETNDKMSKREKEEFMTKLNKIYNR